jgi:bifunctional UDP-N-acetylglucosamine pyrophosphorylase/glucosamine-1-phosphate N-acetyltransferase
LVTRLLIVPAAGLGSRLNAGLPKALVPVAGRPMIDHLLALCSPFVRSAVVVAHPTFADAMRTHLSALGSAGAGIACDVVVQPEPTGMLDAILEARAVVERERPDRVWTIWCDQVGVLPATLARLAEAECAEPAPALVFPTVDQNSPYIHFPRDASGRIVSVLQRRENDAMPEAGESDMGLFALSRLAYCDGLVEFARDVTPGQATRERNFLPFIPWLAARALVRTIPCSDAREAVGINTPAQLRDVETWLRERAAAGPGDQ